MLDYFVPARSIDSMHCNLRASGKRPFHPQTNCLAKDSKGAKEYRTHTTLPAISRPQKPIGGDDQSKLPFLKFIH